ncbi:MAG: DUF5615 family PIN-like protein [Nitrospinae bacterium]|nr:DUF5615 family PIN-like protein [Nitrospinota bacterium]
MPEPLAILLDQNVPRAIAEWFKTMRPSWTVEYAAMADLSGKNDREIYEWAQARRAIIVTFDEDFADQRSFPAEKHCGIIRLRVWPTTIEETRNALERLLSAVSDSELAGALVTIDRTRIRVRVAKSDSPKARLT